jgi:hypothetical protein
MLLRAPVEHVNARKADKDILAQFALVVPDTNAPPNAAFSLQYLRRICEFF